MKALIKLIPVLILGALAWGGMAIKEYYDWESEVYSGLEAQLQAKNAELAAVKRETGRAEEFRRRKEAKLKELQELSAKLEATRQEYPTTPSIPQLLKDLADVADRTGLEFHSFRPQAERRQEFVVTTPIEVRLRGTYVQIMSFLDTSANLKRTVAAEKLSIDSPTTREGSVSVVMASAQLVTYSIDENFDMGGAKAAGAPGAPATPGATPPAGGKGP